MITRRGAAGVVASLPFIGRPVARSLAGGSLGGTSMISQGQNSCGASNPPNPPRMSQWQATKLAMQDPDVRGLLVAAAYKRHATILSIDPDIDIHRSFSTMAKIAFQRQRNVEREISQLTEQPEWDIMNKARTFIDKLMWSA